MDNKVSEKIVFFILPFLAGGGAERVTLALLRAFLTSQRWRPVLILTTDRKGPLDSHIPLGLEVIRLEAASGRLAIPKLLNLIHAQKPDVIFTSLDHVNVTLGLLQPFLPRKTALVLRATSFRSLKSRMMRLLLKWAFLRADTVVFQSCEMRRQMMHILKLPINHTNVVVPNPLDRARIEALSAVKLPQNEKLWLEKATNCNSEPHRYVKLVAAGGLYWAKGFDLLIEAIRILERRDIRLCILGQGAEEEKLRHMIEAAGLHDQIRLCGFQDNPYAWFAQADGFILSSRVEGFPNVVLEALASGCPVVATPMPGLEGMAGVRLCRAASAPALAEALNAFLAKPHAPQPELALLPYDIAKVQRNYEDLFARLTSLRE
jgi:glycosyltransferase involved in cell wall biosynthesis